MKRTLVTSFEPFAGRELNISALVAERVQSSLKGTVDFGTLPVTYSGAFPALRDLKDMYEPSLLVLLGEAVGSPGMRLERYGHNWCFSRTADNEGVVLRDEKIQSGAPECLMTPVNLTELVDLDNNLSVSLSAGAFVCNQVYYLSLLHFTPHTECLFIHVTDKISADTQAEMLKSVLQKLTLSE